MLARAQLAGAPAAVAGRPITRGSRLIARLARQAPRRSLAAVPRASYGGQQQFGGQQQQGQGMYPPIYQTPQETGGRLDAAQEDMLRVGTALRNIGWLSFWGQLALTVVSTVILLFSTGVPSATGVQFSFIDIATLLGIVCGYLSTFLAWSYTRAGAKMGRLQEVKLASIAGTVIANSSLNLVGLGATIIALQATVGSLVAKTLSAASAAGFYGQRTAPPPAAFDVFSVQACTNTIMAHFVGMLFSNWLLTVVNKFNKRQAEREEAFAADTAPSAPPMPGQFKY
ncbi:TIC chloroplastic [Chlorella sorokiniana]|jgi:hypothetical protein|uniref:TIC chloroplastic n=1 Tax=Chlorella sorokiniana TaxID=3076 RepID=A0A2P6TQ95_CHLSO|nr:TIC chloroplastic [Chlorella sorokiniana]|eukprot:PRW56211.1 TIC chloroplastic [Chlorella sorokiniana]